jgi:type II secretory pathway component GspD/PulD (secretin)
MSRKLTVIALFVVSLVMISWSTDVVAEEKEGKSREAQIQEVREQIKELEYALERESDEEKAAKLKSKLQERRNDFESLMGEARKPQKPEEEFPDIQEGIRRAKGNLEELRRAAKALREEGGDTEKLEELRGKIGVEERKLVELNALLEKRRAEAGQKKEKPKTRLMFFPLEHANGENLSRIIGKFLTPEGIIMVDEDTNTLVVRDTPDGLEAASEIVKNLDIPRRRATRERAQRPRERAESENFFFGTVLEAGEGSLTIKTRDLGETVTLHVPLRRKEDGTSVLYEELSKHVASFQAGTPVRVQYRRGEDKLWIQRVTRTRE